MTFKLSPSSLNLMKECPRCFWLHQHKVWKRPAGIFPSLPSGMDRVLKHHFDKFRDKGELPPELCNNNHCEDMKLFPDKELLKGVSTIIIGHEHPAVSIKDGPRTETFKAFLVGKWKKYNLIAQPSFNLVTEGTDVLKQQVLSPFLKNNLKNFNVIIVGDKLYEFGKLKDL